MRFSFENGDQWQGLAVQDEEVLNMIKNGYLYVLLYHSHGGRDVRCRLMPKAELNATSSNQ